MRLPHCSACAVPEDHPLIASLSSAFGREFTHDEVQGMVSQACRYAPRCDGLCVMGPDVLPGSDPTLVAYPHPDCPAHGWVEPSPEEVDR